MIAASVGGQAVATTVLGGQIWRDNGRFLVQSITWREMWAGVKRHKKFPIYSSWSILLNIISWQLPVLMLGAFFSPAVVGFYALGFRILQMPMSLIGGAIGQAFFQRAAKATGNIASLVGGLFQRLLTVALLPSLVLAIIGKDLFIFVFGHNWSEAGVYAQVLALWALVWFISSPLSTIYIVLEQQNTELTINVIIFISRLVAIGVGGYFNSPRLAILLFAVGGIFSYGYLIKVIFDLAQINFIDLFRKNLTMVGAVFLYVIPLALMKMNDLGGISILLVAVLILAAYVFTYRKTLAPF